MTAAPLRVILDDRPMRHALTGVGNYIAQLLVNLERFAPGVIATPFLHSHLLRRDWRTALHASDSNGLLPHAQPPPRRSMGGRIPWSIRRMAQAAYSTAFRVVDGRYDLYHEPNHVPMRSDRPTVTTIHDLSVIVHPEWHPADRVKWYERDFPCGLRQTRQFLAVSCFTRDEMVARLGIPAERITVTYQAPRDAFTPDDATPIRTPSAGDGAGLPERFFLYVGTLEPRKNVEGLLDAFAALPSDVRRSHPLLIAGAWGWKADALREKLAARSLSGDVRLLGYLNDPQLARLYRRCTALVWPTWYEGFGLPPLEAMACGAPVIVSNVASLPEVVGDAGVLLDPADTSAWCEAMRRMAEDDAHRAALRGRGLRQAARFTWRAFIEGTVAAYRRAAG